MCDNIIFIYYNFMKKPGSPVYYYKISERSQIQLFEQDIDRFSFKRPSSQTFNYRAIKQNG